MARSSFTPHGGFIASPHTEVVWDGWRSTAHTLERCGWEFAVEQHPAYSDRSINIVMRHRQSGATAIGEVPFGTMLRAATGYVDEPPLIVIRSMVLANNVVFSYLDPSHFARVSMRPNDVIEAHMHRRRGDTLDVFSRPETKELIVEQDSVAELFERIKQLQKPELDAIRERNRLRDAREQRQQGGERVVAQVIALAA